MKKFILKYLLLGPWAVGLLLLGWNLWEEPDFFPSWFEEGAEEGMGVPQALLAMFLGLWMLALIVFPVINFIYYIINRLIRGRLSYFIFNPIPFFIVLIGLQTYREQAPPTDVWIYVGAYTLSLVLSFVALYLRATWKSTPPKQKVLAVIGPSAFLLLIGALDIFVPDEISGATGGPDAFTVPWFIEWIGYGLISYAGFYVILVFFSVVTKEGWAFTKETMGMGKKAFADLSKISSAFKGYYCKKCRDALLKGELVDSSEQWLHQTKKGDKDSRYSTNPLVQNETVRYFCDKCKLDYHVHELVNGQKRETIKLTYAG